MYCLERIKVNLVTHDVFSKTTTLYFEMGKNHLYEEIFSRNIEYLRKEVASQNTESFFRIFFANDFPLKENRYRTLLLDSSVANNKAELLYKNLYSIFSMIHVEQTDPFQLHLGEINDLTGLLFNGVLSKEKLRYRKYGKKKGMFNQESFSMREELERYLDDFTHIVKEKKIEPIFLYVNFLIDFSSMQVYDMPYNEALGNLIFYILMLENHFKAANYLAFYLKLNLYKTDYQDIFNQIDIQSKQGLADVMPLMSFFINIFNSIYVDLQETSRDYLYDQDIPINKTDYIENTIYKLGDVFSKEDIREKHPSVSNSTINRTLKRLSDENVIRAVGVGRKAKWVKIVKNDTKHKFDGQIKMDLGEE
jgi:hypothetical protein